MFYVWLYVTLCPFEFAIILMGKRERAVLFAWFVLLVSRDCCEALPRDLQFVIVVFPDLTHLLFSFNHNVKRSRAKVNVL